MFSQRPEVASNLIKGSVALAMGGSSQRRTGRRLFLQIAAFCLAWCTKLTHPAWSSVPHLDRNWIPGPHEMPAKLWKELSYEAKALFVDLWLEDPDTQRVLHDAEAKWLGLSSKSRSNVMDSFAGLFSFFFCHVVASDGRVSDTKEVGDDLLRHLTDELERVLKEALGDEIMWDLTHQGQDADGSVDLDVRVGCKGSFTEKDTEKVKLHREQLQQLCDELPVRSMAIKFIVPEWGVTFSHLDLVLYMQRREEFPCFRGGTDFCVNSAAIKDFLETYPAARMAVEGVRTYFNLSRPTVVLLEALAWRLSKTFPLTRGAADKLAEVTLNEDLRVESYQFFKRLVEELRAWNTSSFGDDLRQDLNELPLEKQAEYLEGLAKMQHVPQDVLHYRLLKRVVVEQVRWKWAPDEAPFHDYLEGLFHTVFEDKTSVESQPPPKDSKGFAPIRGAGKAQASGSRNTLSKEETHLNKIHCLLSERLLDYLVCQCQNQTQQEVIEQFLPKRRRKQLEFALEDCLKENITLKFVGSLAQGTASDQDSDVDLEVRYGGDRANESFTEEDKQKSSAVSSGVVCCL